MTEIPESIVALFAQTVFDTDFVPIYALTEQQHQQIINKLANLVVAVIVQLQCDGNIYLASLVAQQAQEVLRDYDDDVADAIIRSIQEH